tara:strand:+ start:341 stop:523 length:183 start_codon:yes stop_codon:yes gene_type:complete
MSNVTEIDEHLPHLVFEAMCVRCCKRWIAVARDNTLLKNLECAGCGEIGAVINTGQEINE